MLALANRGQIPCRSAFIKIFAAAEPRRQFRSEDQGLFPPEEPPDYSNIRTPAESISLNIRLNKTLKR
jgi:hypothetical protein